MRSPVGTITRAFRNIDTPVPYTQGNGGSLFQSVGGAPSNTLALLGATKISGTCYAVVRLMSNAVSQAEWKLYKKAKTQQGAYGDDSNRTEVTKHLALDVLNHPNDFMTRQELFEVMEQHLDIVGEGWAVFGDNGQPNGAGGTVPSSIWPVRPDKMAPVPDPTKFISGYTYTGPGGFKVDLDTTEVMMLRVPDPESPFRGLGPIRSILTTLDSEKYSAEWNRAFFLNSAEPGGIIQVASNLTDPEFDDFQKRWKEMHQGVSKAHRIGLLEGGMTWASNSISHKDMQFIELRTVARDVVLEAFAIGGSMIGVSEHVNKANAQTGEVSFARWPLKDRLERWKQALNNDFLPRFGKTAADLEFDFTDPTPTDDAAETAALVARSSFAVAMVNAGWAADEVLETAGLPAMAWEKRDPPPNPFGAPALPAGPDKTAPDALPADDPELVNA